MFFPKKLLARSFVFLLLTTICALPTREPPDQKENPSGTREQERPHLAGAIHNARRVVNMALYGRFRFNSHFQRSRCNTLSKRKLGVFKKFIEYLATQASHGALHGTLAYLWRPFADATYQSFISDLGAVIYDERQRRWEYCGWVDVRKTFLGEATSMRLCIPLKAFGMRNMYRRPVPYRDYVPRSAVIYLRKLAKKYRKSRGKKVPTLQELQALETARTYVPESGRFDLSVVDRSDSDSSSGSDSDSDSGSNNGDYGVSTTVNLFQSDSYEQNCLSQSYASSSCYSFCCLSVYITSWFCREISDC